VALKLETAASNSADFGVIGVAMYLIKDASTATQAMCIAAVAVAIVSWRGAVRIWGES